MFKLETRGFYAILPGAETFLLFYSERSDKNKTTFIHIPDMYTITFENHEELNVFFQYKKLDFIEQLPLDVYQECILNIKE
jgi:hypothetical protein